jgi:HTH-type transcriptional regulator/antitoxin HigA
MQVQYSNRSETNPIEDFATSPGVTLQDSLDALGMSQAELSERAGISDKTINRIIKGIDPVTHSTALALEKVLQVPAGFWLNLESNYREHLARQVEVRTLAGFADWARRFPYPDMIRKGYVSAARTAEEKAGVLLRFFGVATPDQWQAVYEEMELELSFRKSEGTSDRMPVLSAWLRQGEILAQAAAGGEFDATTFSQNLQTIRSFTRETPPTFVSKMKTLCAEAGVIFELVPELPGLGVSGVMRWFHGRPLIQQSLLFKTNDNFWFTFFHEAKHVLQMRKKQIFIEGGKSQPEDIKREEEANRFAGEILIPGDAWETFVRKGHFECERIRTFARSIAIHPGIVAGRLLKEGRVDYSKPQAKLRAKFEWAA